MYKKNQWITYVLIHMYAGTLCLSFHYNGLYNEDSFVLLYVIVVQ